MIQMAPRESRSQQSLTVREVQNDEEMEEVRSLFREYEAFLNIDLEFQNFKRELKKLPGVYAPPGGYLLIGTIHSRIMGCVALRRLDKNICEMKRLYVRHGGRGTGLGRKLVGRIILAAREMGYSTMRLDTLKRLKAAMNLYESYGFRRIEPYYDNPLQGVIYWELDLTEANHH